MGGGYSIESPYSRVNAAMEADFAVRQGSAGRTLSMDAQDGITIKPMDEQGESRYNGNESHTGQEEVFPDIEIYRSLGAKSGNYDILTPSGEVLNLTEGTFIRNVEVIAGYGRNREIDMVDYLVDKYGGESFQWKKCKGTGYVDVDGESLLAELHWYEEPSIGRVEFKVKPQRGGELFIYED